MSKKKKIIFLSLITIIVVIFVGSMIVVGNVLLPKDYDRVTINNSEVISDVNREDLNSFRRQLLNLLIERELIEKEAKVEDVSIREDSVVKQSAVEKGGIYSKWTSFLVDIDSIKQTYRVNITDSNKTMNNSPVQISCPMISEMKYPEEKCIGVYGYSSNSVRNWVPYELKMDSGEKVLVKSLDSVNGRSVLQIYLYNCDTNGPSKDTIKKFVKDWVVALGDEASENYSYNVRTGYCEGDVI